MTLETERHLLKAIPEPWPAKTKMSMEMNSARAALRAEGCPASAGDPMAIRVIGIFLNLWLELSSRLEELLSSSSIFVTWFCSWLFPIYTYIGPR